MMTMLTPVVRKKSCLFPTMVHRHARACSLALLASVVPWLAGGPALAAGLNDTGITTYSDGATNGLASEPTAYPGQDASHGRDAAAKAGILAKVGGGSAGFDFSKIGAGGQILPNDATSWSCVRDNTTGLLWEVKTDDGGLRDQDWAYSWYNSTGVNDGGWAGYDGNGGPGSCANTVAAGCDTEKFAAAVNASGLCGASDWRLPSRKELLSIVDNSRVNPAIDTNYFPNTKSSNFWSSSPVADYSGGAWGVDFDYGCVGDGPKDASYGVRLVRGGQ